MTYELTLEPLTWDLIPSSGASEIIQNVKCLLMTARGSVFMYRDFGIDCELVDRPINVVRNRFLAEVVKQVNRYEPRCKVKSIRWEQSNASDGELMPVISIELRE